MSSQTRPRIGDRVRVVSAESDILKSYVGRLGTVCQPKGIPNGAQDKIFVQLDKARKQKPISLFLKLEHLTIDIDSPIPPDVTATEVQQTDVQIEGEGSLLELPELEVRIEKINTRIEEAESSLSQVGEVETESNRQCNQDSYGSSGDAFRICQIDSQPSTCAVGLARDSHSECLSMEDLSSLDLPILTPIAAISSQSDSQEFATTAMCEDCHKSVTTSTDQDELTLSLRRRHANHLASRDSGRDGLIQETALIALSGPSPHFSPNLRLSKTSQGSSLVLTTQLLTQAHVSGNCSLTFTAVGTMQNGFVSTVAGLERPGLGKDCYWLPRPGALSSSSSKSRPPGSTKFEDRCRQLGLIQKTEVANPEFLESAFGLPIGWTDPLESRAATVLLDSVEQRSEIVLIQELQRSPSLESSTLIPSCENFPDRTETEDEQLCENFSKPGKTWLDPREIDLHAGTQSRDRTDWETVQRYTELMGDKLWEWEREPLPVIFQDEEGRKYPGDAHHRTTAAVAAKVELYCVDLRSGTLLDAIMFSCEAKANREHGLPLTAKDQRRRIELFLETREQLPESDERRCYSSRQIARYLGLSDSGYRTIVNIINEREMFGKISQFASGDRVAVVRSSIGSGGFWPDGTLGKVQGTDKKKGILVVPDTAAHLDRWMLSHGWIHPDNLVKSDAPWLSGKISQDDSRGRHESPGTDSSSALPPQPLMSEPKSRDKQLLPDVSRNGGVPPTAETPAPAALVNQVAIANGKPDVVAAEIAIGIKHLNSEGLLYVIEAIAHHVGVEVLGDLLVESIYKDEVADLCNKCLVAMDKRASSWMEVEKINFTGLSDSALKLLVKESKRALNERYHPEYFNSKHCGSTQSRKSASSTSAPAIRCGCEEDADEDLTLGVPSGDDEEAL